MLTTRRRLSAQREESRAALRTCQAFQKVDGCDWGVCCRAGTEEWAACVLEQLPDMRLLRSRAMVGLALLVFARQALAPSCRAVYVDEVRSGGMQSAPAAESTRARVCMKVTRERNPTLLVQSQKTFSDEPLRRRRSR